MHCNVTRGDEITFLCSVENVPGVVTPDSYLQAEQPQTHEIKTMEGRLVSNFTLDTADLDLEEAVFLYSSELVNCTLYKTRLTLTLTLTWFALTFYFYF